MLCGATRLAACNDLVGCTQAACASSGSGSQGKKQAMVGLERV